MRDPARRGGAFRDIGVDGGGCQSLAVVTSWPGENTRGAVVPAGTPAGDRGAFGVGRGRLSGSFTVYVPAGRGRGLSGPHGGRYGIDAECADADALAQATGARGVFGLSSGGIIALQAALVLPAIRRLPLAQAPAAAPAWRRGRVAGPFSAAAATAIWPPAITSMTRTRWCCRICSSWAGSDGGPRMRRPEGPRHPGARRWRMPTALSEL